MIESCYWKEELLRTARSLRRVPNPPRWTERAHCVLERDIMIGFFMLRRLIELRRVSSRTRNTFLSVFSYQAVGKEVHQLNSHDIWELYRMDEEVLVSKKPSFIANQFVHAYTSFISRDDTRNWNNVFVVSDFDRNGCIWRVPVHEIDRLFRIAADDYPHITKMSFNRNRGDYDIETN